MQVIKDCWRFVSTAEATIGSIFFENNILKVYIESKLDVFGDLNKFFILEEKCDFIGHCILVFDDVNAYKIHIAPYKEMNGKVVWGKKIVHEYGDITKNEGQKFFTGGHRSSPDTDVNIEIHANKFELQILSPNEQPSFQNHF